MPKFKVGDRVRWTVDTDSWQDVTLTGFTMGSWDGTDPKYGEGAFHEDNIELIPPPIPAPIAERMRGLIADIAERRCVASEAAQISARAIMAELAPVDPDVLEARRIAYVEAYSESDPSVLDGGYDNSGYVRCALAAIKRGRELEREGRK